MLCEARLPGSGAGAGRLCMTATDPRSTAPGSIMPAFPYLFERKKGPAQPGEVLVHLPPGIVPEGT